MGLLDNDVAGDFPAFLIKLLRSYRLALDRCSAANFAAARSLMFAHAVENAKAFGCP